MTQVLNMLFIACALKAAFALKVTQQASVEPPTQACLNAVNALDQAQVQQCDEENGITAGAADIILAAASNADLSEPIAELVEIIKRTTGGVKKQFENVRIKARTAVKKKS